MFVTGGKVYNIANQDDPDLQTHAGHTVRLTGDMKGDTITVSKIVMPGEEIVTINQSNQLPMMSMLCKPRLTTKRFKGASCTGEVTYMRIEMKGVRGVCAIDTV